MKILLTILGLFALSFSYATVKTTLADGDWFDANNWNPVGVPLSEDTLIINHTITANGTVDYQANWMIVNNSGEILSDTIFALHGNYKGFGNLTAQIFAVGDGDSTLVYGTISGNKFTAGNPININYGSVLTDTLAFSDDFENYGLVDVNLLSASGTSFINRSNAAIQVSNLATFSSTNSTNESNATIITNDLLTGGDFINEGDVSATDWTHGSGAVSGTTGRFCVDLCFINNSTINGTVDICDATPSGICDIDMGTIAGTVTNCANGSCSNNVSVDEAEKTSITIFPNPARDFIQIIGAENEKLDVVIFNSAGQLVFSNKVMTTSSIDISKYNDGLYFLKWSSYSNSGAQKIVVRH